MRLAVLVLTFSNVDLPTSPYLAVFVFFLDTQSSRNYGNHSMNKFGFVASKIDCRALMELWLIGICIWCAHHFKPFLG